MLNIEKPSQIHPFSSNTYIISSKDEYAVIDPSVPPEADLPLEKIKYILLTHSHFDHILDIDIWAEKTSAKVMISEHELDFLKDPIKNCYGLFMSCNNGFYGVAYPLHDGDVLILGDSEIRVMETPGHTRGSICYLTDNVAFVGDTVFDGGGYGRWDLPSGNPDMLMDSIEKIKALPDDTVLYPGHGEATTVLQYKKDFII